MKCSIITMNTNLVNIAKERKAIKAGLGLYVLIVNLFTILVVGGNIND